MKWSALSTVTVALLLAGGAFVTKRTLVAKWTDPGLTAEGATDTARSLEWMRQELSLSAEEFNKVCQLHDSYMADCRKMSAEMDAQRDRLKAVLLERPAYDEVALAALKEYEAKFDICERAATAHLLNAAAAMDAESRRAYLELMLPRIFPDHNRVMRKTDLTQRHP